MKIIDLSLTLDSSLVRWPGDPEFRLQRFLSRLEGDSVNASQVSCSVHAGTHVDAPCHFLDGGAGVDQLQLGDLIGPARVVELPGVEAITPERLAACGLEGVTRLLIKTGNSDLWEKPNHEFKEEFAALTPEAAAWLTERKVRLVGVDYLSVQGFHDQSAKTHLTLLSAGVIVLEGLDLRSAPPGDYTLVCLPLKLAGSDGAPARTVLLSN